MGNFFNNLGAKIQAFMLGRNGSDKLSRWALGAAIIVCIINMFFGNVILFMLCYALLFYSIYRMFSRNVSARQSENQAFENFLARFTSKGRKAKGKTAKGASKGAGAGAKTTSASKVTFTCEECGQSLSVPKGRGKLKVTCPKCHHQQTINS